MDGELKRVRGGRKVSWWKKGIHAAQSQNIYRTIYNTDESKEIEVSTTRKNTKETREMKEEERRRRQSQITKQCTFKENNTYFGCQYINSTWEARFNHLNELADKINQKTNNIDDTVYSIVQEIQNYSIPPLVKQIPKSP